MRGFAGFGSGMLMAPIFALLFGPVQTVAVIILMEIAVTVQLLPGVKKHVQWSFVGLMGGVATLFMPFGSWLLVTVDAQVMTRIIAVIVLGFVFVLWMGWRYHGPKKATITAGIGAISGTMMAATSLGNPPVMLYMLAGQDSAAISRANVTAYFAITLVALFVIMLTAGLVTMQSLAIATVLLLPYMLAAWLGSRLFSASDEQLYRNVALVFLLAAGIIGLVA